MSPHSPSAVSGQRSQASFLLHAKRDQGEPFAGEVLGLLVSLIALVGLTAFLSRHTQIPQQQSPVKVWKKIPFVIWTVFAVLADSWVFVLATIILSHGSGANWADWRNCSAAIIICLILYVATKIVRELLPDNKTLQLVANITPVHMPLLGRESGTYVVVLTLNFVHRISRLENGRCIIGARRSVLVPLIACDVLVNIYLTTLFLIPLRNLNSSTGMLRTSANARLRSIALRTFIGACCTATSSIIHNNSNSSDYHEAVASAGPIHWDNIFTLFGNDDGHGKQASSEVTPSTLEAATAAAVGSGDDSVRPKPSRTLSSIHSIGSIVTGDPSQEEWAQRLEIGEEEKIAEKTDEIQ
ncbi:hypothetical protein PG988_005056 [Apiospora saccharicola]